MKENKSIALNAILNVIKQCCSILFPMITFPYVSRILGVENYGKYNFGQSIVSYFALFAALGITNYAIREGSRIRKQKGEFENFANQVFTINVITTFISYFFLVVLLFTWSRVEDIRLLIIVQSSIILFSTLGTDWINSIFEDYGYITIRYIIFHILSILLMFLLVKDKEDYVIYAAVSASAVVGSNLFNVFYIRKKIHLKLVTRISFSKHFIPMLTLFCNSLSIQLYVNSDITLLGMFTDDTSVGIYSTSVKIYNIIKQLMNAIIVVMIPRISLYLGQNNEKKYNELLKQCFHSVFIFIMPIIIGVFSLSKEIISVIGGEEYIEGHNSLKILSIALIGAVLGNFFSNAILVPNKKEKYFLFGTITAALTNILLNIVLIPILGYIAAALTTVIAELIVMIFGIIFSRGLRSFKLSTNVIASTIIGCISIVVTIHLIKTFIITSNVYLCVLFSIVTSVILYFVILVALKNECLLSWLKKSRK